MRTLMRCINDTITIRRSRAFSRCVATAVCVGCSGPLHRRSNGRSLLRYLGETQHKGNHACPNERLALFTNVWNFSYFSDVLSASRRRIRRRDCGLMKHSESPVGREILRDCVASRPMIAAASAIARPSTGVCALHFTQRLCLDVN